eukprot:376353-Heterocapsa_arctica.AAC.1
MKHCHAKCTNPPPHDTTLFGEALKSFWGFLLPVVCSNWKLSPILVLIRLNWTVCEVDGEATEAPTPPHRFVVRKGC